MDLKNFIVGVIGAGTMGIGIAQVAASHGHKVVIYDTNEQTLEKSLSNLKATLAKLIEKGKITQEDSQNIISRIQVATDLKQLGYANIVIEAIIENLEIKKEVFAKLEEIVSHSTILATNTSSLSIASIAGGLKNKERFLGIHFFNPVPLMALVEIIPSFLTNSEYVAQSIELIKSWGKLTVTAKDTPGFIVNRVARPFYSEALRIYDEGIADFATIDYAMKQIGGFRMGPFELMDYIGHDVNYIVSETVWKELYFEPRIKPSLTQKRLLEAGTLGRKSGKGFYDYSPESISPEPNKDEELSKTIFNRIICMLINEAYDTLYLGIASKEDIETSMTKGVNYPKGLFAWADEIGLKSILSTLDNLYQHYQEERYRACVNLKYYAAKS